MKSKSKTRQRLGLSAVFFVAVFFSMHAHADCTALFARLRLKMTYAKISMNNAKIATIEWLKNFKTREGAKKNALQIAFKPHVDKPDTFAWGFVTRIDDRVYAGKWYQSPFRRFYRGVHTTINDLHAQDISRPKTTYYISLFNGIAETSTGAFNAPFRRIAKRLTGVKSDLRLPYSLTRGVVYLTALDLLYNWALANHVVAEVQIHADDIDELIENDYRYDEIKLLLQQGKVTKEKARVLARIQNEALEQYYRYSGHRPKFDGETAPIDLDSSDEALDKLLQTPMFYSIKEFILDPSLPTEGFRWKNGPRDAPTPEEIQGLVDDENSALALEDLMPSIVRGERAARAKEHGIQLTPDQSNELEIYQKLRENPDSESLVSHVVDDNFTKALITLRERGAISEKELIYRLQEDVEYQKKFAGYGKRGIERLKKDECGVYTNQKLTNEDIRTITMRELGGNKPLPTSQIDCKGRGPASVDEDESEVQNFSPIIF